ncbi:MAG: DUF6078 family protein [Elusimicrobiaceae bacterium]|nr:DUF6078 family protein [Elusimicrobiaceae bacterium]
MKFPQSFPLCNRENCPQAAQCLRRKAWDAIDANVQWPVLSIANPLLTATDGHCPSFKPAQPVTMARGFRNTLSKMPHGKVGLAAAKITNLFCESNYYKMRRGDRPITPREQEQIARIFKNCGAPESIVFDEYYEDYLWLTEE